MAATSPVSLCSNALILLGGQPISSFTDGSTESQIASLLYENTYHAMLTETQWHFATKTAKLARHTERPDNGYNYKFQLPSDHLYVVKCSDRDYEIYERDVYANSEEVTIMYVYPVDEANLPPYFAKALEYNLAAQFAIPLTDSSTKANFYANVYQSAIKKARFADASQRPPSAIEDSPYIQARR